MDVPKSRREEGAASRRRAGGGHTAHLRRPSGGASSASPAHVARDGALLRRRGSGTSRVGGNGVGRSGRGIGLYKGVHDRRALWDRVTRWGGHAAIVPIGDIGIVPGSSIGGSGGRGGLGSSPNGRPRAVVRAPWGRRPQRRERAAARPRAKQEGLSGSRARRRRLSGSGLGRTSRAAMRTSHRRGGHRSDGGMDIHVRRGGRTNIPQHRRVKQAGLRHDRRVGGGEIPSPDGGRQRKDLGEQTAQPGHHRLRGLWHTHGRRCNPGIDANTLGRSHEGGIAFDFVISDSHKAPSDLDGLIGIGSSGSEPLLRGGNISPLFHEPFELSGTFGQGALSS